jgi:hypothetical protein
MAPVTVSFPVPLSLKDLGADGVVAAGSECPPILRDAAASPRPSMGDVRGLLNSTADHHRVIWLTFCCHAAPSSPRG